MRIPLSGPDITQTEIDAVTEVLRSGRLSLGPKLDEFEACISSYVGAPYAAAVSSGTAGLHLTVRALGIGEGDEVIVPSFTFIAAANAIRYERATPVFVDIDPATLNLDPNAVQAAITSRTRAILAVHTFGVPVDLSALAEIAKGRGLLLIEDACEAVGAESHGKKVGTFGAAGVFGFYPNKQITTGEGGVVVSHSPDLIAKIRSLRNQGRSDRGNWFDHEQVGFNYRLSELHAALGVAQMKRIDAILARRSKIALGYHGRLASCSDLILPLQSVPDGKISWFVYVVRLANRFSCLQRDSILRAMGDRGIACGRYFAPIHSQPAYNGGAWHLPVTEQVADRVIALPFFNGLRESQMDEVCSAFRECIAIAK